MATEAQRRRAHEAFEQTFGPEIAEFVMEHLSPVPWTDVARRADIDALRSEINGRFALIDGRFAQVDGMFAKFEGRLGRLEGRLYAAMAAQTIVVVGLVRALT